MELFFKTLFIYLITLIAIRLMGKREIGELTPFDLVVSIMIAELGVLIIENEGISLVKGLIPIFTLAGIEIIIAYLSLKNSFIRELVNGSPTVLIKNGELMVEEMTSSRYTIHDLLTQLRENGIFNISDVEFAVLETSGELTVLPKSQKRGLTPEDLGLETTYEGLPIVLIEDGRINYEGLYQSKLDEDWLLNELESRNISQPTEVILAALETDGNLYISTK
ncbi:YetF domain-containing protein [Halanaerobaculum tunisiense]